MRITIITFMLLSFCSSASFASVDVVSHPLTLQQAEILALTTTPDLKATQANTHALKQQAIADKQLQDPKVMLGAINVPTDTFSFNQDDMTMVEAGVEQYFPPGHSRAIKSAQTEALALAEQRKTQSQQITILRQVREIWLVLFYWERAAHITHENQLLYQYLLQVIKSQYSERKATLSDILQVQLKLSHLQDNTIQIKQQIDSLRADLGRWIGQSAAHLPLANSLPEWSRLPALTTLEQHVLQHPLLKVDAANILAARDEVKLSEEQYKPGWTVDMGYGIRQGDMMGTDMSRSNMLTAQVTMDLPLFTANRQARQLRASTYQLESSQYNQQMTYRELQEELITQYDLYQELSNREQLYQQQLVPETTQNSKAALLAFQSSTADLTVVLRAYTTQLNTELEQQQILVERLKARAALLYLAGI